MACEPHFVVKYSSYLGTAIKLVLYILKQLFASVSVNSGGYLPCRSGSVNIHRYSPPLRRIIVKYPYIVINIGNSFVGLGKNGKRSDNYYKCSQAVACPRWKLINMFLVYAYLVSAIKCVCVDNLVNLYWVSFLFNSEFGHTLASEWVVFVWCVILCVYCLCALCTLSIYVCM